MEISLLLAKQIAELFLMMAMGYAVVKAKKLGPEDSRSLSVVALYIVNPCVIISAFQVELTEDRVLGLLLAFGAAVTVHVMLLMFGAIIRKLLKTNDVETLSVVYSNAGNLVIPIVMSVLGDEYVVYSSAFIAVQITLLWTHCKSVMAHEKINDVKSIVTNINLIAIVVGVALFAFGIKLPTALQETASAVKLTVGPICMFSIGMILGGVDFRAVFSDKRVYLISALRMLAVPAIFLPLFRLVADRIRVPDAKNILLVVLLALISPAASTITQMSIAYGRESDSASAINVVTTLSCIITMPIAVLLYLL